MKFVFYIFFLLILTSCFDSSRSEKQIICTEDNSFSYVKYRVLDSNFNILNKYERIFKRKILEDSLIEFIYLENENLIKDKYILNIRKNELRLVDGGIYIIVDTKIFNKIEIYEYRPLAPPVDGNGKLFFSKEYGLLGSYSYSSKVCLIIDAHSDKIIEPYAMYILEQFK